MGLPRAPASIRSWICRARTWPTCPAAPAGCWCAATRERDRRRRCVGGLALLDAGLPLLQFLGDLALVAPHFGDQRDHAGVDGRHQDVGFLPLVVPASSPLAPPGRSAMSAPRWSGTKS